MERLTAVSAGIREQGELPAKVGPHQPRAGWLESRYFPDGGCPRAGGKRQSAIGASEARP